VSYLIYAERKVAGHMQARTGPNRVGPLGLLQPSPTCSSCSSRRVHPGRREQGHLPHRPDARGDPGAGDVLGDAVRADRCLQVTDINVGLLLFLAMSSIGVYSITLGGWSSNNKYALLGGLRSSAQMISYELAMGLSTIGVLLMSGTMSLVDIVHAQAHGPLPFVPGWYVFTVPGFIAFAIFMITALAETNRAPFDLPEAESELVAGFHTEYSSMKWALFFLGEYAAVFAISSVAIVLFLGGWHGPFLPPNLQFLWFLAKLSALVFFFIWVRWTFPRFRYDQLMHLGWKVLLPISVLNLVATAIWVYVRNNR
jgi:NADH-quinone oxidoreductase subunit H